MSALLQCYCYVCDCLASQCQHWGNGAAVSHHCNAFSGDHTYKLMRAQRNRRQQEERNPNNNTATAAGTSAAHAAVPAAGVPAAAAARPGSAGAAAAGRAAVAGPAAAAAAGGGPAAAALASARALAGMLGFGGGRHPQPYPGYEDFGGVESGSDSDDDMDGDGYYDDEEGMLEALYYEEEAMRHALGGLYGGPHRYGGGGGRPRPAANQPCNLTEMPDPRTDPSLVHLATLEMQCKVRLWVMCFLCVVDCCGCCCCGYYCCNCWVVARIGISRRSLLWVPRRRVRLEMQSCKVGHWLRTLPGHQHRMLHG